MAEILPKHKNKKIPHKHINDKNTLETYKITKIPP